MTQRIFFAPEPFSGYFESFQWTSYLASKAIIPVKINTTKHIIALL